MSETNAIKNSPNRLVAVIFGAVYIVVGLLGFTVGGDGGFFSNDGELLLGVFEVNNFHNVAHLLIGAALLFAGLKNVPAAKTANLIVGAAYLLLGIIGLFIIESPANILAINGADNVLHYASAAVLLAVALGTDKSTRARV